MLLPPLVIAWLYGDVCATVPIPVLYVRQEGDQQQMGVQGFLRALHDAGASPRAATEAWLSNQHRWVMWKLAAYEASYPEQLKGKLLRTDVVLDQLKYRCTTLRCIDTPLTVSTWFTHPTLSTQHKLYMLT